MLAREGGKAGCEGEKGNRGRGREGRGEKGGQLQARDRRAIAPGAGATCGPQAAQASRATPATPRRAAPAAFHTPAPTAGAPLSELLSTPLLVVVVVFEPVDSDRVDGTWPSANDSPQTDVTSPVSDDALDDDEVPLLRAASSLVTRPCAQSVQKVAAGSDSRVEALSDVRVETVSDWPVALSTDLRRSVTQNVLLAVY